MVSRLGLGENRQPGDRQSEMSERVTAKHVVADDPLILSLARALERLGCRVVMDAHGENLVVALGAGTSISLDPPRAHQGDPWVEIQVQGLPNLLHEGVHIVLAERLDNDHGIDYGAIPFRLDTAEGRQVWWEELSCCVVSCAYLCRPAWDDAVDAWFAEQVEIQPVFYGFEADPRAFFGAIPRLLQSDHVAYTATLERAYLRMEDLLRFGGAPPEVARPRQRLTAEMLIARQGWLA